MNFEHLKCWKMQIKSLVYHTCFIFSIGIQVNLPGQCLDTDSFKGGMFKIFDSLIISSTSNIEALNVKNCKLAFKKKWETKLCSDLSASVMKQVGCNDILSVAIIDVYMMHNNFSHTYLILEAKNGYYSYSFGGDEEKIEFLGRYEYDYVFKMADYIAGGMANKIDDSYFLLYKFKSKNTFEYFLKGEFDIFTIQPLFLLEQLMNEKK